MALTHFDIRFVLEHNHNIRLNLPIADSGELRFQRVQQLLGRQFSENAYWIDADSISMRLSGWLGHPSDARSQADLQYVYVNGRIVKDKLFPMLCAWRMKDFAWSSTCSLFAIFRS